MGEAFCRTQGDKALNESPLGIFRLLNPSLRVEVAGYGGITPQDIAHLLAQLKIPGPPAWARFKWALQSEYRLECESCLLSRTVHGLNGHRKPQVAHLQAISSLAVHEHAGSHLCRACNGRGSFQEGNLLIDCPQCRGVGHCSPKANRRLGDMEKWEFILDDSLKILDLWDDILTGHIREFLYSR